MANVATTIAMDPTYLPFERPPDLVSLWSAIPRGLRGFIVPLTTVDAKPINDTQTLSLTATLPASFAYIFSEIGLRLAQDRQSDWTNYNMNLQNWYQGTLALSTTWAFERRNVGLLNDESAQGAVALGTVPKAPMWAPRGVSGILINITMSNSAAAAALAGNVSAFVNFWEFDLEQAKKFPINTPFPTHSR